MTERRRRPRKGISISSHQLNSVTAHRTVSRMRERSFLNTYPGISCIRCNKFHVIRGQKGPGGSTPGKCNARGNRKKCRFTLQVISSNIMECAAIGREGEGTGIVAAWRLATPGAAATRRRTRRRRRDGGCGRCGGDRCPRRSVSSGEPQQPDGPEQWRSL
ncbi:hypothetical protein PUN28_001468 [Cardiocondyla obscurior]|uniref:Uncharacterized protein n=1 Tax=Cardiocondyla obscurior TaxID=286306 RepID=A0AAW2H5T6_9HYME